MTCWEILGIEPTGDRQRIKQAYEQQLKFASSDEAKQLNEAFREATGEAPATGDYPDRDDAPLTMDPEKNRNNEDQDQEHSDRALDSTESQVVREVVIQVKALLNDPSRSQDVGIWKAILCEPPADRRPVRSAIASQLEPQLRPMAENGTLPKPVAHFLGGWFEWFNLQDVAEKTDDQTYAESGSADEEADQPPQMVNFWPAVVGWIVGLAILASLFSGMGGGGG